MKNKLKQQLQLTCKPFFNTSTVKTQTWLWKSTCPIRQVLQENNLSDSKITCHLTMGQMLILNPEMCLWNIKAPYDVKQDHHLLVPVIILQGHKVTTLVLNNRICHKYYKCEILNSFIHHLLNMAWIKFYNSSPKIKSLNQNS